MGVMITMLRSIFLAFLTFLCPFFRVNKEIKKIQRRFCGGGRDEKEKKVHYVGWENVCKQRKEKEIRMVSLETKNRVKLNKWLWRFGKKENSL